MKDYTPTQSVFVKIDDFREVAGTVESLKAKIREVRATLSKVEEMREKEREALEHWRSAIDDVEDKIHSLNADLLEH